MVEELNRADDMGVTGPGSKRTEHSAAAGSGENPLSCLVSPDRILARLEVLGLLDDQETAQEVIDVFVCDAGRSLEELDRAIQTGDAASCERLAHRVKGSSLNLGIEELGDLARALEEKGRSGSLSGAAEIHAAMRLQYQALCSIAPRILRKAA
jgi:HPt (histidine-containing phosphotransfer) domain-containing protein